MIRRAYTEVRLLVILSNYSGYCCVLPLRAWHMERPYCDWKTKFDRSISYAVTGLVIAVNTWRGDLLCNRLSKNSPVFGKPQRSASGLVWRVWVSEIFISYRKGGVVILSSHIGFLDSQWYAIIFIFWMFVVEIRPDTKFNVTFV